MRIVLRKGAKNAFGPALRRAREQSRLKMTQSDLAELITSMGLPIDRSAISRIENQEKSLSDLELLYFAAALRTDIQKLYRLWLLDPAVVPAYNDFKADDELVIRVAEDPSHPAS
ncbi:MAG: helix-turn-helix transcriptional regulator [Oceanipulchritudo sp.]